MFSNYFIINQEFLNLLKDDDKAKVSELGYSCYKLLRNSKSSILSKEDFYKSTRTRTAVTFLYCPKCKTSGFLATHFGHKAAHDMKYCSHCGERSIDYKFSIGKQKISSMIQLTESLELQESEVITTLKQQTIALISSVYEVYLREFYADILNSKFVKNNLSLYGKFIRDSKNEFQNPGKTQHRLKNDLDIDYRKTIGEDYFKYQNLMPDFRNVIIHNNGICDSVFAKNHPEVKLGSPLVPRTKAIKDYFAVTEACVKKLDLVYQKELLEWVVQNISTKTNESVAVIGKRMSERERSRLKKGFPEQ